MVRYNTGLWHTLGSAFWLGRAIGRRPNHCSTRCNRTNETARGSGLGPFACNGRGPAQIGHTPACVQAGSPARLSSIFASIRETPKPSGSTAAAAQ